MASMPTRDIAQQKRICLITGATDGIGKATALELARKGFTVVLVARNVHKAEMVKSEIATMTGATDVDYVIGNFNSLKQVHELADVFKQKYPRLDVLINNAGIFSPQRIVTDDGYEMTYQVNYLSHFVLTHLLLDHLKRSENGRIVNLASSVYNMGKFDPQNLQSERHFSTIGSYSASKLLVLMFTANLAEKLRHTRITVNAANPGVVKTKMMTEATGLFKIIAFLALPFSVAAIKGAATSVYLASAQDVERISGKYFVNSKVVDVKSSFNTQRNRDILWNISMQGLRGPVAVECNG
jgi:retinol dehydrogenase-12